MTLNLNGQTINNTTNIWNDATNAWSLISVRENGDLTIEGDGTLKAKEGDCYAVDLQNVSTHCTINGGTFVGNISAVYVLQGNLTVNAGNFSIQQLPTDVNDERRTLNCYNAYCTDGTARITVTGGTFNKFDPANGDDNVPGTFVASGYESIANADGTYTV